MVKKIQIKKISKNFFTKPGITAGLNRISIPNFAMDFRSFTKFCIL